MTLQGSGRRYDLIRMELCAVSPVAGPYLNQRRELPQDLECPGVRNRPASVCVRKYTYIAGIVRVRGQLKSSLDEHAERTFTIQYLIF